VFKSVEYAGFDGHPELKAKAEQLTGVLAREINTWRERVEVRWTPHPNPATGVLDLTLSLTLPNGVSATRSGTVTAEDSTRDPWLAARCRRVWSELLGLLLNIMDERIREFILDPVEV
jgi:hypothetical protein